MKIRILAAVAGLQCLVLANELPFAVYNPTDSQPKKLAEELKPEISENVRTLIEFLKEPKDSKFISLKGVEVVGLKWRVQHVTILSAEVVSVNFTEGHVEVIAIYVRDERERRWDLKAEIGGAFRDRSFRDPDPTS